MRKKKYMYVCMYGDGDGSLLVRIKMSTFLNGDRVAARVHVR